MVYPIVVMSFDRPDYLEKVLQSLKKQIVGDYDERQVILSQDAAYNPLSQRMKADPLKIQESINVFKEYFPMGTVLEASENLGVAFNFDRAEKYVFEELQAPAAIFLEDDLVLSPWYIGVLSSILDHAVTTDYIGVASAYGYEWRTPISVQMEKKSELCLMNQHNWAFGITRWHWLQRNEIVKEYLDIIRPFDYQERGKVHREIFDWIKFRFGRSGPRYLSSQDSIKNMATEILNVYRIATYTNNAKYIGEKGEHMNPAKFATLGYFETELFNEDFRDFTFPSVDALKKMRRIQGYV